MADDRSSGERPEPVEPTPPANPLRSRRLKLNEKDVSTLRTALEKKNQRMDTQVIPVLRWSEDTIDTDPEGQPLDLAEDEPRRRPLVASTHQSLIATAMSKP